MHFPPQRWHCADRLGRSLWDIHEKGRTQGAETKEPARRTNNRLPRQIQFHGSFFVRYHLDGCAMKTRHEKWTWAPLVGHPRGILQRVTYAGLRAPARHWIRFMCSLACAGEVSAPQISQIEMCFHLQSSFYETKNFPNSCLPLPPTSIDGEPLLGLAGGGLPRADSAK